jgi:hypothetical protein
VLCVSHERGLCCCCFRQLLAWLLRLLKPTSMAPYRADEGLHTDVALQQQTTGGVLAWHCELRQDRTFLRSWFTLMDWAAAFDFSWLPENTDCIQLGPMQACGPRTEQSDTPLPLLASICACLRARAVAAF